MVRVDGSVSVVVSTLDRPQSLARTLDAVLSGSLLPTEVVVVDQGDPDAVAAVLGERRAGPVRLVHVVQRARGLSVSQNAGVAAAGGSLVAVIDDDCVPSPHWLEVAVAAAADADLVTGRVLPLPPDGDRVHPLSSRRSELPAVLRQGAAPWDVGTGGSFAVRRQAFLDGGGNDVRLGAGAPGLAGNDLDLFHRLLRSGVVARYEPAFLVHHERATAAQHGARRDSYGFGVGACVGKWLREGDPLAGRLLLRWVVLRARRARAGRAVEEARVLRGTARGLLFGLRHLT